MVNVPPPLGGRPESDIVARWTTAATAPVVSVICHTFNHSRYLRDAVHGFLSQLTDFPFEIIIRDDASTDGSGAIAREMGQKYPRIIRVVVESENRYSQGVMPSVATFPMARGRFIALCEGDDYWSDPRKLQRQVEFLAAHPEAGMAIHPATMLLEHDGGTPRAVPFCVHGEQEGVFVVSSIFQVDGQYAPTSSYLLRASFVPDWVQFMSEQRPTYGDFFIEAIASKGRLAYLPEAMSVYRRGHADSYSRRQRQLDGPDLLEVHRRNAAATRALRKFPGISDVDIERRLALMRHDCLRQLMRAGAFTQIAELSGYGPIAVRSTSDRLALRASQSPRVARLAWRGWRMLKPAAP